MQALNELWQPIARFILHSTYWVGLQTFRLINWWSLRNCYSPGITLQPFRSTIREIEYIEPQNWDREIYRFFYYVSGNNTIMCISIYWVSKIFTYLFSLLDILDSQILESFRNFWWLEYFITLSTLKRLIAIYITNNATKDKSIFPI